MNRTDERQHEAFDGCSAEELTIFEQIASGEDPTKFDPKVVDQLKEKNLLNDHAGFLTVPYSVLTLWEKRQEQNLA